MKKLTKIILSSALALSLNPMSFAADDRAANILGEDSLNDSSQSDVKATYNGTAQKVYSVDLTWGSLNFTYAPNTGAKWDPDTHTYTTDGGTTPAGGTWDYGENGNIVALTNHSNANVNFTLTFDPNEHIGSQEHTAISTEITNNFAKKGDTTQVHTETTGGNSYGTATSSGTLVAAIEGSESSTAPKATATLTLDGCTLDAAHEENTSIGTFTVQLNSIS